MTRLRSPAYQPPTHRGKTSGNGSLFFLGGLFLLFFLLVFRLRVDLYDLTIPLAFLSLFFLYHSQRLPLHFLSGFALLLAFSAYTYIISIAQEPTVDSHILLKQPRVLLSYASVFIITWALLRNNPDISINAAHKTLAAVLSLHPLILFLQVVIPSFNEWWAASFLATGAFNIERGRGLSPGTSAGGQILGFISLYYFYLPSRLDNPRYALAALLTLPLYPLSALAGLAPFTIGFLYWTYSGGLRLVPFTKWAVGLLVVMAFTCFAYFIDPDNLLFQRLQQGLLRVFAGLGFYDSQVLHGDPRASQQSLLGSYSTPPLDRPGQWLFGNAQEYGPDKTFSSDAGFVRFLHVYGITGTALAFFVIAWFVYTGKSILLFLFALSFFVLQYKNHMLFGRISFDLFFLWWTLSILERNAYNHRSSSH